MRKDLETATDVTVKSIRALRREMDYATETDLLAMVGTLTDRRTGTIRTEIEEATRRGDLLVDVIRQRRSGDGAWVAVLRALEWTGLNTREGTFEVTKECASLAEAREAAREMLITHAHLIASNATVEAALYTKSEFDAEMF